MQSYDLCIIGGGAAGFAGAMRAMDFQKRVCLIEKNRIGGAAIFNGALASKTWWELAKDFDKLFLTDRGYRVLGYEVDFQAIQAVIHAATQERQAQMIRQIQHYQGLGLLDLVYGTAQFITPHRLRVSPREGAPYEIQADHILIATGSRPRTLPDLPIDAQRVFTSDHLQRLTDFPSDLLVIGSGVIGCELATIFSTYPGVRVTMIERADRILPYEDSDVTEIISQNLADHNVRIYTHSEIARIEVEEGGVRYWVRRADGAIQEHTATHALISIGRVSNTEDLGLDQVGIGLSATGHITTRDTQTSLPHIFAAGDVDNRGAGFVNVAEQEARYAVERMFGKVRRPLDYDHLSWIMFLRPEVAGVGLNEQQARAEGYAYRVARYDYHLTARGLAMRTYRSFFKLITTDEPDPYILGCRAVGPQASSIIGLVAMMIRFSRRISDLCQILQPHPALTEGIQECARSLLGEAIFKPELLS